MCLSLARAREKMLTSKENHPVANTITPANFAESLQLLEKEREITRLLAASVERLEQKLAQTLSQMDLLLRRLYGRSSERYDPSQLWLDGLMLQADAQEPTPAQQSLAVETPVAAHVRKRDAHGRGIIPEHLPREITEIDIPDDQKTLPDGTPRPLIGHEDAERIAYEPSRLFVKVERRLKYGSPSGAEEHGVVQAPVTERLVPRCLADESLIAHVVVSKFADHLPTYRLEGILKRSGLKIPRQTLCGWIKATGLGVEPLVRAIRSQLFATGLVHSDDTPVDLLEDHRDKPRGKRIREARLWVARCAPRDGPWTVFDFTESRSASGPEKFFADYTGKLVCDAFPGYDTIVTRRTGICLFGCWAHVRRYFMDAHRTSHPLEGAEFLAMIVQLYSVERTIADADDSTRLAARQEHSVTVLEQIRQRMDELLPVTQPKSALGKALGYANRIWERLCLFVNDPQVGIDNNPAENAIRPVALGRKNWLFIGERESGRASANLMTLIATCKNAGVEPFAYLSDILVRLPETKTSELRDLLPDRWLERRQATQS